MDAEAAEVARRQDESESARKQLIERSREFKKSASEVRNLSLSFSIIMKKSEQTCMCCVCDLMDDYRLVRDKHEL